MRTLVLSRRRSLFAALAVSMLTLPAAALAQPSAAERCEASKLAAAASQCACRLWAAADALTGEDSTDACAGGLERGFARAESIAEGDCRVEGDAATVDGRLEDLSASAGSALGTGGALEEVALWCEGRKLKAVGRYCQCVARAHSQSLRSETERSTARCDSRLARAFVEAEEQAAGQCPTEGDAETLAGVTNAGLAEVEADLADRGTEFFAHVGEFGLGRRNLTFVDSTRPTDPNGTFPGAPDRTMESVVFFPTNRRPFNNPSIGAPVLQDEPPFPLVIRAHGFSGFNADSTDLSRHLASFGYIVVSPNFPLSNLSAPGGPTVLDIDEQPADVSFLIDTFLAMNEDPESLFFGRVDPERIGVIGHSLGGATALLTGYHTSLADSRVDAIVALAPLGCPFLEPFFDGGTAPLMIVGATEDLVTEYTSNQLGPYNRADAAKYLVTLEGATHTGFANQLLVDPFANPDEVLACAILLPPGAERPLPPDEFAMFPPDFLGGAAAGIDTTGSMCAPLCPLPPPSILDQRLQTTFTLASAAGFFESELRGDISARRLIDGRLADDNPQVTIAFER